MKIKERIKIQREKLGLSYTDIAEFVGVNRTTIMRYEKGATEKMPISLIQPLSEILQCSPMYLMGWTDNPNEYPHIENLCFAEITKEENKDE